MACLPWSYDGDPGSAVPIGEIATAAAAKAVSSFSARVELTIKTLRRSWRATRRQKFALLQDAAAGGGFAGVAYSLPISLDRAIPGYVAIGRSTPMRSRNIWGRIGIEGVHM